MCRADLKLDLVVELHYLLSCREKNILMAADIVVLIGGIRYIRFHLKNGKCNKETRTPFISAFELQTAKPQTTINTLRRSL